MPKGFLVKRSYEIAVPAYQTSAAAAAASYAASAARGALPPSFGARFASFLVESPPSPQYGGTWCDFERSQFLAKASIANERTLSLLAATSAGWLTPPAENASRESAAARQRAAASRTAAAAAASKPYDVAGRRRGGAGDASRRKRRTHAMRKIAFDHEPPVSGIIIRPSSPNLRTGGDGGCGSDRTEAETLVSGDIDSKFNVVEITEEAKAKLASIENKIGSFVCRLCNRLFADAFRFAQHRCPSIIYVEYKCPECGKVFNCPANLASHRRWHKPRRQETPPESPASAAPTSPGGSSCTGSSIVGGSGGSCPGDVAAAAAPVAAGERVTYEEQSLVGSLRCRQCGDVFKKLSALGRHVLEMHPDDGY